MNYRHIYHAGNMCDIVKHSILMLLIDYMKQKDKGFALLDTHAGCGMYDLNSEEAQKTNESDEGIGKLWTSRARTPEALAPYLSIIEKVNHDGLLSFYPGSPLFAAHSLRPQDRLILCELHPEDAHALRRTMRPFPTAQIHNRDGYEAIKAFLPFAEKRGLILIDPPFEDREEYSALIKALAHCNAQAPQVTVAIWYPIKDRPAIWQFHEDLSAQVKTEALVAEFLFQPEECADKLNGSGLAIINPPWILHDQLSQLFPALHDLLKTEMNNNGSIIRVLTHNKVT
ncbi:MAG: 23S rRNA (adenine(2030)-N(6))-methyltransferase RlmJ [Proteobacteria bacterium]|nr:23S rRNA (adenine(2030)-N(6))-methyltransferase RlmJ [Pseudomonadota bacterium]